MNTHARIIVDETDLNHLLLLTHRGDRRAAVRLHALIAPCLLAYARSLLRHDSAAEDIVQQVFLQVLSQKRHELAAITDVLPWFIRLTRNAAFNHARAVGRTRQREHARAASTVPPVLAHHDPLAAAALRDAIDDLPDDDRELILLKHIAGLTFDQMSVSLGENRNTIASRYRAAVNRLNVALSPPAEAPHA